MCFHLGPMAADSVGLDFLKNYLYSVEEKPEEKGSLDRAMKELDRYGFLQWTTYVEELIGITTNSQPIRDLSNLQWDQMTPSERRFLQAQTHLESYRNYPEKYEDWLHKPRLRLRPDFKEYVDDRFKAILPGQTS